MAAKFEIRGIRVGIPFNEERILNLLKRDMTMSNRGLSKTCAAGVFALGLILAGPVSAQMGGMMGGAQGQGMQQMSGMMHDMSGQMMSMSGDMAKGKLSAAQQKQMAERMRSFATMMNQMSGMMGAGMPMDSGQQKMMGDMRMQMDHMMGKPSAPMGK